MRYYILENDPLFSDLPLLNDWGSKINPLFIRKGDTRKLPSRELIHLYPNEGMVFIDIIVKPFLLLAKEIKYIVSKYQPGIVFKEIALMEPKNEINRLYYLAILEELDCLHESNVFNRVKTRFERPVLISEVIKDQCFFKIAGTNKTHYVIRQDLVESLIRRQVRGMQLTPVELC